MPASRIRACLSIALLASATAATADDVLLTRAASAPASYDDIIDTRPLASCRAASLAQAICLPVEDLLAPRQRLANWSGIYWLLGSAGLTGDEHLLIVGEQVQRREFIAGLLLLTGQRQITVLDAPMSNLLDAAGDSASGRQRATTRSAIYRAPMRSDLLMLQAQLQAHIRNGELLLDGRSEAEYHGATIHAGRGGHIPGAQLSPVQNWRTAQAIDADAYKYLKPIAYGHSNFDSIGYLAALHAAGVNARVYLPGWAEWAANGALPIDSASYPPVSRSPPVPAEPDSTVPRALLAVAAFALALSIAIAYYSGRAAASRAA